MSWKRPNVKERMSKLLGSLPKEDDGYWIDIGTGDGTFAELIQVGIPKSKIVQTDIRGYNITKALHFIANLSNLPLRNKCLDGIVCAQVLHYIDSKNLSETLTKLIKKLEINGVILIIEYMFGSKYPWVPFPICNKFFDDYVSKHVSISKLISYTEDGDKSKPKYSAVLQRL